MNLERTRPLVPPLNFAPVEERLYRSGEPTEVSFEFLETLHLRTIVWLAIEDPGDDFVGWADDHDVELKHLGLLAEGANPWDQLTDEEICCALRIILDSRTYPILVCCSMGRHRTGTVIGCLRKLQHWSFASLIDEYQRSTGPKGERVSVELRIERFYPSSVALTHPPKWFLRGSTCEPDGSFIWAR